MMIANREGFAIQRTRRSYSAADYVQNGLYGCFDGLENVGWGVHSDTPSAWIDLAGHIGNMSINPSYVSILENGVKLRTKDSKLTKDATPTSARALEACVTWYPKVNDSNGQFVILSWGAVSSASTPCLISQSNRRLEYSKMITGALFAAGTTYTLYSDTSGRCYVDGIATSGTGTDTWGLANKVCILCDSRNSSYTSVGNTADGTSAIVHSVRIYNRTLAATEVTSNCLIDKERFG